MFAIKKSKHKSKKECKLYIDFVFLRKKIQMRVKILQYTYTHMPIVIYNYTREYCSRLTCNIKKESFISLPNMYFFKNFNYSSIILIIK